jgi:hypothetical protein
MACSGIINITDIGRVIPVSYLEFAGFDVTREKI